MGFINIKTSRFSINTFLYDNLIFRVLKNNSFDI